jgi:hypothetical protein
MTHPILVNFWSFRLPFSELFGFRLYALGVVFISNSYVGSAVLTLVPSVSISRDRDWDLGGRLHTEGVLQRSTKKEMSIQSDLHM